MDELDREQLQAAALVIAARAAIVAAVGELAASPLNEAAAQRMRLALAQVTTPKLRRALWQVGTVGGPDGEGEREDEFGSLRVQLGGVA